MSVPMGLLRALLTMLPRLEAEERLQAVQVGQVASGWMKGDDARPILQRWARAAAPAPRQRDTNWAAVGRMGMGLRKVTITRTPPAAAEHVQ